MDVNHFFTMKVDAISSEPQATGRDLMGQSTAIKTGFLTASSNQGCQDDGTLRYSRRRALPLPVHVRYVSELLSG